MYVHRRPLLLLLPVPAHLLPRLRQSPLPPIRAVDPKGLHAQQCIRLSCTFQPEKCPQQTSTMRSLEQKWCGAAICIAIVFLLARRI
jgi:hypothetical protein